MNLETIQEMLSNAIQTDWEHGVAWMNDEAAAEFKRKYPTIWNAIAEIMVADLEDMS
tara:strand:- start:368 stop:538 length:171 start_codon:yes stop_codon:yes gene_type:complete